MKRRDVMRAAVGALAALAAGRLFVSKAAQAHEYEIGKLVVEHPWVRAPADGDDKAYLYAFIHNLGESADRLVGVKAQKFGRAELHANARNDEKATGIDVPAQQATTLAPGGAYALLLDVKKHLEVGWGLEMTLVFEKAGEVVIDAAIEAPDAVHAHDAEAMARWEKAQSKDTAGPAK